MISHDHPHRSTLNEIFNETSSSLLQRLGLQDIELVDHHDIHGVDQIPHAIGVILISWNPVVHSFPTSQRLRDLNVQDVRQQTILYLYQNHSLHEFNDHADTPMHLGWLEDYEWLERTKRGFNHKIKTFKESDLSWSWKVVTQRPGTERSNDPPLSAVTMSEDFKSYRLTTIDEEDMLPHGLGRIRADAEIDTKTTQKLGKAVKRLTAGALSCFSNESLHSYSFASFETRSPFHSAIDHTMKELFSPTRSDIFALKTPVMSPTPSQGSKTTDSPSRTPKATITVNTSVGLFGISGGRSALSSPKLTPYTPTKHVAPNQAMITTNASYEILTCNEVAVRLVGYSSVDIIGTNILSILCSPYREKFRKLLQAVCSVSGRATCLGSVAAGDSLLGPSVLACGSVIRIKRKDRSIYPASLWLKESANDSGSKIYIWVFEKIDEDMIELEMSSEGLLYDVCGEFSKLYGADFSAAERLYLQDICPSLLIQDDSLELLDIIKKWKFFGARSREGATFPILLRVVADQPLGTTWPNYSAKAGAPLPSEHDGPNLQPGPKSADDLDPEASIHLQLISMPNIAGVVTVHENGLIQSCNSIFTKFLFGLTSSDIVEKSDITELLPQFWQLLSAATNNGSDLKGYTPIQLIPPSKCRKVAAVSPVSAGSLTHFPTDSTPRTGGSVNVANVIAEATRSTGSLTQASRQAVMTSGVIAVHRDGTRFNVDLHIRPVHVSHEVLYAVWITFDRALHSPPMSTTQPSSPVRGLSVAGDQSPVTTGSWSTKRPPEEVAENKEELPKLPAAAIQTPAIGSPFTIDKELDIGPGSPVAVSDVLATDSVILSPQGSEPLVGERDGQGKVTEARESEGQQETKLVDSAETELKEVQGQKRDSSSEHVPEDLDEGETECSPDQFTLKEFEIIKPIGEGSYGFVRVVTRKNDPREKKYVMKFVVKSRILVECWMRDKILGLVPLEIHIMNFLKNNPHQNVVQMLKYFEDDDYFYILMDMHGHGIDLFEFIDRNQTLTEGTVRKIIYQVILAVRHLHRHDIVHRDIKDENVIVDDEYSIKLIDFGSSAYLKPNKKPFETFFGTIDYASPEILSGDKYEGKPQDVWALGILFFTLIYGETPFYNIEETIACNLRFPFPFSPGAIDVITKTLSKDAARRPTAEELAKHPYFEPCWDIYGT